jgi:hypothetical protein
VNALEHAQRQAAWVWASQTLGIETTPERLSGLVEITEGVRVENLKSALKAAMQTNQSSFLPAAHLVIEAANRIAGKRREAMQERFRAEQAQRVRLAAQASPASPEDVQAIRDRIEEPEDVQAIRDRIEELARNARGGMQGPVINKPADDSRGIAAAKAAASRGGRSE